MDVEYEGHNEEMAINVALCYFPIALLLFGAAWLVYDWLIGIL